MFKNGPLVTAGAVVEYNSVLELPVNPVNESLAGVSGTLYIAFGGVWTAIGGGSPTGVDSVNGKVGVVSLTTDDIPQGATNRYATSEIIADTIATIIQSSPNIEWVYNDPGNTLTGTVKGAGLTGFAAWNNGTNTLTNLAGWNYNTSTGNGADVNLTVQPNNTSSSSNIHNFSTTLDPISGSPNDSFNPLHISLTLDPNSTGFALGSNGQLSNLINVNVQHLGTADIGNITAFNYYTNIGNGVDPIELNQSNGFFLFGDYNDGVNFNGGMQGYIFQPHVYSGASFNNTGTSSTAFADNAFIETSVGGWNSANFSPRISGIFNNSSYNGVNINPELGVMQGNSGATFLSLGGSITTLGTGGFQGLQVNTLLSNLNVNSRGIAIYGQSTTGNAEWVGLDISTNSINTTGSIRGVRINVDTTQLYDHVALDVQGQSSLGCNLSVYSGGTQIYGNQIGGSILIPSATSITGTDVIFNNLGANIDLGNNTSSYVSPSGLVGISSVGFVGQIQGAGSASLINFLLAGFQANHTGNIAEVNNILAAGVPANTGTITNHTLFRGSMPAGAIGTNNWGVKIDSPAIDNAFAKNVIIGGSTFQPTNASVGLEIAGTTKAILNARLTTTQVNSLTAVNGMQAYNTTTGRTVFNESVGWTSYEREQLHTVTTASNGGSFNITAAINVFLPNSLTVASYTVNMPSSPINGQKVIVSNGSETNSITSFTMSAGANSINNELTTLTPSSRAQFLFDLPTTTWYRIL